MTTGYGNQYVRIWIDFNEITPILWMVLDNYIIAQGLSGDSGIHHIYRNNSE